MMVGDDAMDLAFPLGNSGLWLDAGVRVSSRLRCPSAGSGGTGSDRKADGGRFRWGTHVVVFSIFCSIGETAWGVIALVI
jgi:hypothetical protein